MVSPDAVKCALELVIPLRPDERDASMRRIEELRSNIEKAELLLEKLFPVENTGRMALQTQIDDWVKQVKGLNRIAQGYRPMDKSVLTWRDQQGWPRLGLFNIRDSQIRFSYDGQHTYLAPYLPSKLSDLYEDVRERLKQSANGDWRHGVRTSASIEAEFKGFIPDAVRERIHRAKPDFESIYLLAEVEQWSLKREAAPLPRDPIVAGFDGERLWYIDAFDLTPVEHYIKSEFIM